MKKDEIVDELIRLGWVRTGETRRETVRFPTHKNPLYGKAGGELVTFGGRVRLCKRNWFVTVGERTTYFYSRESTAGCSIKSDLQAVIEYCQKLEEAEKRLDAPPENCGDEMKVEAI